MSRKLRWIILATLAVAMGAAQTPSFTGRWKLNPARSSWGNKPAPAAVTIDIDHRDQVLKYSGIVVDTHGEERYFEFAGATDGKDYPATRASGEGKAVLEQVGPYAILATFKSNDGGTVEKTGMRLSRDGKVLTYRLEVTEHGRTARWTEVYERR